MEALRRDPAKPLRVMLVEDHADFRRAIATLVNQQPDLEVVAEAGSLDEARRHAASIKFEVMVLDLRLPDGNGIDMIEELRRAGADVAVLVLSATLDPANLSRVKEAGADRMLDKFATPGEICAAIRSVGGVAD